MITVITATIGEHEAIDAVMRTAVVVPDERYSLFYGPSGRDGFYRSHHRANAEPKRG